MTMVYCGLLCGTLRCLLWIVMVKAIGSNGQGYGTRYWVGADGAMGVTLSPEQMSTAKRTQNTNAVPEKNPSDTNFQKLYMDFLRSQMPRKDSLYTQYDSGYGDSGGGDYSQYTSTDSDGEYLRYDDYENSESRKSTSQIKNQLGIETAAKELTDGSKKTPKTLSTKCTLEGGFCVPFSGCDTSSHIYKGYCATDYSSVCCVPRQTVCEANDGICTDDREACVAAGEIMGRKYNLRFYTWMDCNNSHVCCRPSQVFSPFPNAQKERNNDIEDDEGTDEDEEDEDSYSVPRSRKQDEKSRKRKPEIGKVVKALKGFQNAVNPDFAGFPDDKKSETSGRRQRSRLRSAASLQPRLRQPFLPRSLQQIVPVNSPYGVPYQSAVPQQSAVPGSNPYLGAAAQYPSGYPSLTDYMSAYASSNPSVASRGSGYPASYSDQTSLLAQSNVPAQGTYTGQSQSAAQPSSLFGNIFL